MPLLVLLLACAPLWATETLTAAGGGRSSAAAFCSGRLLRHGHRHENAGCLRPQQSAPQASRPEQVSANAPFWGICRNLWRAPRTPDEIPVSILY